MQAQPRRLVIKIGPEDLDSGPFTRRDLGLESHSESGARKLLSIARGLVIAEPQLKYNNIQRYFRTLLPLAEQHGLVIRVLVHSEDARNQIIAIRKKQKDGCGWTVQTFFPDAVADVAQAIVREYSNPVQEVVPKITPPDRLTPEQEVLISRAFFDSSELEIAPLGGGKAAEAVFLVNSSRQDGVAQRPLPFFVKFAKIEAKWRETMVPSWRERRNYRDWAEAYVPFYLRPNVDHRRCVRGSRSTALVGNFVENAIQLRAALRMGVGDGVLFSLFETTLRGFRSQPFEKDSEKQTAGLENMVRKCARVARFQQQRDIVCLAMKEGLRTEPGILETMLRGHAAGVHYWQALSHGDLHDGNIMVRGSDAIVIDFGSVRFAPLTADLAALEVSLIFRTDPEDKYSFEEWQSFLSDAYDCIPRIRPLNPEARAPSISWLHRAIREVRHILFGADCTEKEHAIVLAAHLLRFAGLDLEYNEPLKLRYFAQRRRAHALVIAELLIDTISELA